MKQSLLYLGLIVLLLFCIMSLSSCAEVSPQAQVCVTSDPYGFWSGLWHGMISPIAWIVSLFNEDVAIYAYDNNGGWYDFGFILGIGGLGGSSSKVKSK